MSYAKDCREYAKRKREYVAPKTPQRNILVRTLWFCTIGWMAGGVVIVLALICCCGIITWPLVPGLIHAIGPAMTLRRKASILDRGEKLWGVAS